MRHSHVERAAVLPIPDDRLGERACIAIMLRDGVSLEFDELLTHLRENGLSRYDMPEFGVHLTDIPLMSNGKIEKRAILKELIDGALLPKAIGKRK